MLEVDTGLLDLKAASFTFSYTSYIITLNHSNKVATLHDPESAENSISMQFFFLFQSIRNFSTRD